MHPVDVLRKMVLASADACRFLARRGQVEADLGDGDALVRALRAARLTTDEVRRLIAPLSGNGSAATPVTADQIETVKMRAQFG